MSAYGVIGTNLESSRHDLSIEHLTRHEVMLFGGLIGTQELQKYAISTMMMSLLFFQYPVLNMKSLVCPSSDIVCAYYWGALGTPQKRKKEKQLFAEMETAS